jgi:dTDP-4-amino-4,6-dideoxygalactose transaminase
LCNSGSLALEIALRACDLRPGDEVVIPTFCCTSVLAPILAVGAHPVLADVGEELNITSETLQPALTKNSRAIIVPRLFGNPADIEPMIDLVRARNIRVVKQTIGSSRYERTGRFR